MQTDALAVLALVSVLALAGCTGTGGPGTPVPEGSPTPDPTPTASPTSSPATTAAPTSTATGNTGSCERPTPEPVPDMSLVNRLEEPRTLSVSVTPADGTSPVYEESLGLEPDEDVDRYDVVPETNRYRIVATLPDNTSATKVMEIEPGNRYGLITVIVRDDRVFIERLNVHPEPTPTPCSEPRTTPTGTEEQGTERPTPSQAGIDTDAASGVASPGSP